METQVGMFLASPLDDRMDRSGSGDIMASQRIYHLEGTSEMSEWHSFFRPNGVLFCSRKTHKSTAWRLAGVRWTVEQTERRMNSIGQLSWSVFWKNLNCHGIQEMEALTVYSRSFSRVCFQSRLTNKFPICLPLPLPSGTIGSKRPTPGGMGRIRWMAEVAESF